VEVGQWVQPPSINTRIRVIQANTRSHRFYVPPYVSSNGVDSDCVVSASVGATVACSTVVDHAIVDCVPVVDSAICDWAPVDSIVVCPASDDIADACLLDFRACMFNGRDVNGACCHCYLCLLLNVHACYLWRKQKFVEEAQCFRGVAAQHIILIAEFMEGVVRRLVDEASEEVEKKEGKVGAEVEEKMDKKGKNVGESRKKANGEEVMEQAEQVIGKTVGEVENASQEKQKEGDREVVERTVEKGKRRVIGERKKAEKGIRGKVEQEAEGRQNDEEEEAIGEVAKRASGEVGKEVEKMVEKKTKTREGKIKEGRTRKPGKAEIARRSVDHGDEKDGKEADEVMKKEAVRESEKGVDEDEVEANQVSGDIEDEMEQAFGHNFGFPTGR
jgi:hypothetical protein